MFESLVVVLGVALAAQLSPGPDMMLIFRHTTTSLRAGMACILGICLGFTFHVTLSVAGLAVLIRTSPVLFNTIRYAGAAYILYVGIRCLTGNSGLTFDANQRSSAPFGQAFRDGLFCNLLNPKVTLFVLSVFSQLLAPETPTGIRALFGLALIVEAIVVWTLFSMLLDRPAFRTRYERFQNPISRGCGVVLCGLAVLMVAG
ncbi:LysE family translocator [Desulfoluna spongiiphila]|uniref:Resistance to homoserine/threonine (RhtB) family protein n=1 Tax=Desulfoluna spongiiphila TaxID=419481 RepID=A0A1G5DHL5_9BACT|nr:LysE family transporter [Desulfoluna spongiiphila]SCY14047.1 resistance to homoserine/threonine (RhtB) family protein [Desulfoluna spongiiphila]